jgi:steroid delta-isomerase-like uncharacterized protein
MSETESLQFVEEAVAAFNAHDADRYVQQIDDDYVGERELSPGPVRGRAEARQITETIFNAFPDIRLEVEQVIASGDFVVVRGRLTGTHKGSYAGIAATDKSVSWGVCNVSERQNGKVIRSRVYADNASLLQQLGVLSLPRTAAAG